MWQVGSTCYGTKTAAFEAIASSQIGAVVNHGGAAHIVTSSAVAENGIEYSLLPFAGGSPIVQQAIQEPMPCNLLTVADSTMIAWAIAGGWIAIYLIKSFINAGKIHDA